MVGRVKLRHHAKLCRNRLNCGQVSFSIMRVWLENAYSCPFCGFFWVHFPRMMSLIVLTPKRAVFGLNHVI